MPAKYLRINPEMEGKGHFLIAVIFYHNIDDSQTKKDFDSRLLKAEYLKRYSLSTKIANFKLIILNVELLLLKAPGNSAPRRVMAPFAPFPSDSDRYGRESPAHPPVPRDP